MDVYENRLESFTSWPKGLFLRPQVMAAAGEYLLGFRIQTPSSNIPADSSQGFFHTNWDSDEVQCFNCAVVIENWQPDDDPFQQHLSAAPQCSFVNKTYMSSLDDRLASFHAWSLDEKPMPIHMAAAGFFRSNQSTDAATCFCCTLRLEQWDPKDDPIQRHIIVLNQTRGRPCAWLEKITKLPEKVSLPTPLRVAARWNDPNAPPRPHKCGDCQTVYPSGKQYKRHLKEAGHMLPRKANAAKPPPASGSGVNQPKRVRSLQQRPAIQPEARERPSLDSNVTLAPSPTPPAHSNAEASELAKEERRRNPPGTTGFLGSHRVMKSTAKPRPKANTAAVSSAMEKITGLLKREDDVTPQQDHAPSHWDDEKLSRPAEAIPTGPRVARQQRREHLQSRVPPQPRSEWDAPPQPRQASLIGDYTEPSPRTDWNSAGVKSSSGW